VRGDEEGGGFAQYDRTIYSSAIVFGYELLFAFLVKELVELQAGASGNEDFDFREAREKLDGIKSLRKGWNRIRAST
jgi:hypothetical protein